MSFLLLAAVAVLVLGYVLHPSVRERVFSSSPSYSVGAFKRRMHALGNQSGHESNWLSEPVYQASGRQVLVPSKPIGAPAASASTSAASPLAEATEIDKLLNPRSAETRRQTIQIVLGSATAFFLLAGFFSRPLWIGAFVSLVAFLGYLGLLHEAHTKEEQRQRREELQRVTRRGEQPAVPQPVQQVQRGYTIDLTAAEKPGRRGADYVSPRSAAGRRTSRPDTGRRHGPPRGHANPARGMPGGSQRRPVRRRIDS